MRSFSLCVFLLSLSLSLSVAFAVECSNIKVRIEETILSSEVVAGPVYVNPPNYNAVFVAVRDGTLYRSIDNGRTWNAVTLTGAPSGEKIGITSIVTSFDKIHMVFIGFKNHLWISNDAGTTLKYAPAPGVMKDFTFHPTKPDWVLALAKGCENYIALSCSDDLHLSTDTGKNWVNLRSYVWDYEWSVGTTADGEEAPEPIIVYWEKDIKQGRQDREPWNSSVSRTSTLFRTKPDLIAIDVMGFLVMKSHIFVARKSDTGVGLKLLSSENNGLSFHGISFPLGMEEQRYTILDVNDGSTFINVEHEGSNWGNVYSASTVDRKFSLSLEKNVRAWGAGKTEFKAVEGIEGIYLANVFSTIDDSGKFGTGRQTMITYDKGGRWARLPQPIDVTCGGADGACKLNLAYASWYTRDEAIGMIIGTGNIGFSLSDDPRDHSTFISRDAGWTWESVDNSTGTFQYDIGNRGAVILSAETDGRTDRIAFSLDEGKTWDYCLIKPTDSTTDLVDIDDIANDPNAAQKSFLAIGTKSSGGVILHIDFGDVNERPCRGFEAPGMDTSDYEYWIPSDTKGDECILGRRTQYVRRKRDAKCWNTANDAMINNQHIVIRNCTCTRENYQCDYCFIRSASDQCVPDPGCQNYDPKQEPYPCLGTWPETRGYRKVPGDSCNVTGGVDLMPIHRACKRPAVPSPTSAVSGGSSDFAAGLLTMLIIALIVVLVGSALYALSGKNAGVRSFVTYCIPERFLPELNIPKGNYGLMTSLDDDDDDLHRGAKAIDLEDSDEEQPAPKQTEEFSLPRETKSSGPATGILI